jgi:Tat protein secretion system quality control protein TatD with DNase activity
VLERAARESVAVIITGSCLRSTQAAAHFADTSDPSLPAVYFTAGVHPHNAKVCAPRGPAAARGAASQRLRAPDTRLLPLK